MSAPAGSDAVGRQTQESRRATTPRLVPVRRAPRRGTTSARRSARLARPRPGVSSGRKGNPGIQPRAIRGFGPSCPAAALAKVMEEGPRDGVDESRWAGHSRGDLDEAQRVRALHELLEDAGNLPLEGLDSLADAMDLGLDSGLVLPQLLF